MGTVCPFKLTQLMRTCCFFALSLPYVFNICGIVAHKVGSPLPHGNLTPKYAQLYVYGADNGLDHSMKIFSKHDDK